MAPDPSCAGAEGAHLPARGRHDREGRERALLDAATAVFAECGYDPATTRAVAERAGCAEGLIHRYFGGKRGLLIAILEGRAERLAAEAAWQPPDSATLQDEIEGMLLHTMDVMWEHRDFMRVSVSQGVIDPEVGRRIAHLTGQRSRLLLETLRHHQAAGHIRADVDLPAAAEMINVLGFEAGFMGRVVLARPPADMHALIRTAAEIIARGLATSPSVDSGSEPPATEGASDEGVSDR